jgi:hypothetical protein
MKVATQTAISVHRLRAALSGGTTTGRVAMDMTGASQLVQ